MTSEEVPGWSARWMPPDPGRVARARAEWIELFEAQYAPLACFLLIAGSTWEGAFEVATEAFLGAWGALEQDPRGGWEDIGGKQAWVRASALRERTPASRGHVRALADGADVSVPWEGPELSGRAQAVLRALWALDDQSRSVLAFTCDGIPAADTAEALRMDAERVPEIRQGAQAWLGKALGDAAEGSPGQLLADVHREILAHVVAAADVPGGIAEVMRRRGMWVPASVLTASPQALIRSRILASRLAGATSNASIAVIGLRPLLGTRAAPGAPGEGDDGPALARRLVAAIERASGYLLALGPDFDLRLDLAADARMASRLARLLEDGSDVSVPAARDLLGVLAKTMATARFHAKELEGGLGRVPVDASGADLSGLAGLLDLVEGHLGALNGVTWTPGTTWPAPLLGQVRELSSEASPGVYAIHVPY